MRCWLFHKWSKWEPCKANMVRFEAGKTIEWEKQIQMRKCLKCNLIKTKDMD